MLVWIDIETTGLEPRDELVLEVACIVTDDQLNEVARYQNTARFDSAEHFVHLTGDEPDEIIESLSNEHDINAHVIRMHAKNGLWKDCANATAEIDQLDVELASFLRQQAVLTTAKDGILTTVPPQLAGSTINFDREFMRYELPESLKVLHYRNVDVSTLNELAKRFWPGIYETRPNNETKAHRGMADIEESVRVCKHYLGALTPRDGYVKVVP